MDAQIQALFDRANKARLLYKKNMITRAEAHAEILPYIMAFNKKSEIIAKKYKQKPKQMNFASFVR